MTINNHDTRQRFAAIRKAVAAVPENKSAGTKWLSEMPDIPKPPPKRLAQFVEHLKSD